MVAIGVFYEFLKEKGVYEKYWSYVGAPENLLGVHPRVLISEPFKWYNTDEGAEFWDCLHDQWQTFLESKYESGELSRENVVKEMMDFKSERLPTIADVMLRLDLIEKKLDKLMYVMVSSKGR